ncbi:11198_t:CDS:2, partial [Funneliformis geosporum]
MYKIRASQPWNLMQCSISDKAVKEIAKSYHKLEHLDVYGCNGITDSAIREITRLCSNLKYFSLEGCKCSRKVIEKLDRNIEVEWFGTESDWSDT